MDEDRKKQVAVFRFGVISDFVTRQHLERGEQELLLVEKCAQEWRIPFSNRTRISPATVRHWIRSYERGGRKLEALYPQSRSDRGMSRSLDEETAHALIRLRKELPHSPVHLLVAEMKRRSMVTPGTYLGQSTVYRFLRLNGLMEKPEAAPIDRRRFEAEFPNDIWQSDAMHGPQVLVGDKKRKVYLFAFLDDMSRLIPHAQFYTSELLDSYLDALRQALLKRGLPRKLYVDNGPAFRARHLEEITASLGIALVHSSPYKPQGRGKCERWFKTVRTQFLSTFKGGTLEELNAALDVWIREVYHPRSHSSTGEPPLTRFAAHLECIRPAPKDIEDHFRKRALRRVAKDRTLSLNGRLYEAPVPLIGKQVTLLYHDHDPSRVEILLQGLSHGFATTVDLNVNCRVSRHQERLIIEPTAGTRATGGKLSFRPKNREDQP